MSRSSSSERLRKLLALARDQEGTPEGEAAARLARRLMLRGAREQASRRYQGLPDLDPVRRLKLSLGGRDRWRRRLLTSVARHVGCVAAWRGHNEHGFLFGHASATVVGEYLYVVLSREVDEACTRWLRDEAPAYGFEEAKLDPENEKRITSFCQSAVSAIDARLLDLRDSEAGLDPKGTALVLDRRHEVDAWMKEQGVELSSPAFRPWRYSPEGYLAGYRIPLHDAVREEGSARQEAAEGGV